MPAFIHHPIPTETGPDFKSTADILGAYYHELTALGFEAADAFLLVRDAAPQTVGNDGLRVHGASVAALRETASK